MANRIIWSEAATEDFDAIVEHVSESGSVESARKFVNYFFRQLDVIDNQPYIGMSHAENPQLRKRLIDRKYYLYYLVEDDEIIRLLNIIDTRSGPGQNPFAF